MNKQLKRIRRYFELLEIAAAEGDNEDSLYYIQRMQDELELAKSSIQSCETKLHKVA